MEFELEMAAAAQEKLRDVQGIQATYETLQGAFAAITSTGSVVTWGHPDFGGDSRAVSDQLPPASKQVKNW